MAIVWLRMATRASSQFPIDFRFLVDKQWLTNAAGGADLDTSGAIARLNITSQLMEQWRSAAPNGSQFVPQLRVFDGLLNISAVAFSQNPDLWRMNVIGSGPVRPVSGVPGVNYECQLETGAATIWTRNGFLSQSGGFDWGGGGTFLGWVRSIWPEPNSEAAAIRIGRDVLQVEVKSTNRRRLILSKDRQYERVWKLSDCKDDPNLVSPRDEIGKLKQDVANHLTSCALTLPGRDRLAVAERRSLDSQSPAEVYYRVSKADTSIQRMLRPDFDIRFSDAESAVHWSPGMATSEGRRIELHDADHIAAMLDAITPPGDPDPVIRLRWTKPASAPVGQLPTLVLAQVPAAECIGVSTGEVQGGYVWQYAASANAPPSYPQLPVLVRYQIAESERLVIAESLPVSLEGAIPISQEILSDQWRLSLTPQAPVDARLDKSVSLTLNMENAIRSAELEVFDGSATAVSPPILSFTDRLADPAALPNPKVLTTLDDRRDPFGPTSLVFATKPRQFHDYRVRDLARGEDLSSIVIWQTKLRLQPSRVAGVFLTPLEPTASFTAGQTSSWTINVRDQAGVRPFVSKTFNNFPSAGLQTSLGDLASPVVLPGAQLELTVVNTNTVNLPPVNLRIEFDSIASLAMQPETAGNVVTFQVVANSTDALQLYWPHNSTAVVDPIPAAASNLQQSRDFETLRTIVERDASHGMTPWTVRKLKFTKSTDVRSREGGEGMAAVEPIPGVSSLRTKLHSAMSLLPWVACRDEPGGNSHRQLHSRNLVLEPGEMAAASQDRTIDGRPMAFANNELDYFEAVRDPFTLAVDELPTGASSPSEIVNWLPGATLNKTPAARMKFPAATDSLAVRLPEVGLYDNGTANGQILKILHRDGSGPPASEPIDWLSYQVRRDDWDRTATPVRPKLELTAVRSPTAATNRQRLARNASVPLLFDTAAVTCADVRTSMGSDAANWIGLGDQRGRIVVLDLARATARYILRTGSLTLQPEMKGLVLARTGNTDWVVTVDAVGDLRVWKSNQGLAALNAVTHGISNLGPVKFATGCQVGNKIALLIVPPGNAATLILVWDPNTATSATNPQRVTALPGVVSAELTFAQLVAQSNKLLLAVAHEHAANPAVVLRGQDNTGTWQFTSLQFPSAVAANPISVGVIQNAVMVATIESSTSCRMWKVDNADHLEFLDISIPPVRDQNNNIDSIVAVGIGSRSDAQVLRPVPTWETDGFVYLSSSTGRVVACGFDLDATQPAEPRVLRDYVGVNGVADRLLAVELSILTRGERGPHSMRPHIIAFGPEGIVRLWDSDSQQMYRGIDIHEDVYDNLGVLRTVHLDRRPLPKGYVEPVNRPGRVGAAHGSSQSAYAPFDSIVDLTLIPTDSEAGLLFTDPVLDPESRSELFLVCDRLRLCKSGDQWMPEKLADDLDPGPDRPRLKFPFHRGFVGRWGMYSRIPGECREVDYWPRIAGVPIYPTSLNWLKFETAGQQVDFSQPIEVEFDAAIVNPLELDRFREKDQAVCQPPGPVQRAIHDGSVVRINLRRNAQTGFMEVHTLSSVNDHPFKWNLPLAEDAPVRADEGLEGHLALIVGKIGYEIFRGQSEDDSIAIGRITLRLNPAECLAELLGGQSPLDSSALPGQTLVLAGYGERLGEHGQRTFGFETPLLPPEAAAAGMLPLDLVRTVDHISLSSELTAIAVDGLQVWNSIITGTADANLTWWDWDSAKPWSITRLDDNPTSLSAIQFDVPTMFVASGTRLSAHDPELKYRWIPGTSQQAAEVRTDWSDAEPITALAAHGDFTYLGNSIGTLSCWDLQGRLRFTRTLFGGPVIQLAVRRQGNPAQPLLAAFDSTQPLVTLVDGITGDVVRAIGLSVLFAGQPSPESHRLRQVDLAQLEGELYLSAVATGQGGTLVAGWWKIPTNPTEPPILIGAIRQDIESVVLGLEDTVATLYFVQLGSTPKLFSISRSAAGPQLIGDLTGTGITLASAEDENTDFVIVAAPGQGLVIWEKPDTGWVARNLTVRPSDLGTRLALQLERLENRWVAVVGPGDRLGDEVRAFGRIAEVIALDGQGTQLYEYRFTPGELGSFGMLGPRVAAASCGQPHAVVARHTKTDLQIIDLRSGLARNRNHQFDHGTGEVIRTVHWVRHANEPLLITATKYNNNTQQSRVVGWNPADGNPKYSYAVPQVQDEDSVEVLALVSDGEFAAFATNKLRLWRWSDAPDVDGSFVEFGDDDTQPETLAMLVRKDDILLAVSSHSTDGQSRGIEVWSVPKSLDHPANRLRSWNVDREVVDLVILDSTTISVTFKEAGPQVSLVIYDLSSVQWNPIKRWQRRLTAPNHTLSGRLCVLNGRPVLVDGTDIDAWRRSPYTSISSNRKLDCRLPVKLQAQPIAGFGTLTADLSTASGVNLHLTSDSTPSYPARLVPGSVYKGTFGLIGRIQTPGSRSGELGVCVWRNSRGNITGGFIVDQSTASNVKLKNVSTPVVSIDAQAEFLHHRFIAFNPDAAATTRSSLTTSGRIVATLPQGKLTLYLGDQHWHESSSSEHVDFFTHLVWQSANVMLQGTVLIRRTGPLEYSVVDGVYRIQKIKESWQLPTPSLLQFQAADLEAASGQPNGTLAAAGLNWNVAALADYSDPVLGVSADHTSAGIGAADGTKAPSLLDPGSDNEMLVFSSDGNVKINSLRLIAAQNTVANSPRIEIGNEEIALTDLPGALVPRGSALTIANRGPGQFGFGSIWVSIRESDVQHPLGNGHALLIDMASPEIADDPETRYVKMQLTVQRLQLRTVDSIDIPFDPCLDPGIAMPFPTSTPAVPQLSHRQLLGTRLRHREQKSLGELLSETGNTVVFPPAANTRWLAAPVCKVGTTYRILNQSKIITADSLAPMSTLQTENLVLLSRDDTDSDDLGAIVGIHHQTGETESQYLLSDGEITVRIGSNEAAGTIFHRVLRGTRPAQFRIIPRSSDSLGTAPAGPASARTAADRTTLDFRLLPPVQACGLRRSNAVRYFPEDPPVDRLLDRDRFAWRRFGFADALWPDRPPRSLIAGKFGYLIHERTAFHKLPLPALPPANEAIFPDAALAPTFRPRCIEMQLAPDKPGAMVHHQFQAIEAEPIEGPVSQRLPRPPGVASEPLIDFALREPMQLAPPPGTDLQIESTSGLSLLTHRQAVRVSLKWKETLGAIDIKNTLLTEVPLEQVDWNPDNPPTKEDVHVGLLARDPFLQIAVRINDEFLEIDERQPQFPVYDARQAASSHLPLEDRTKLFREGNTDSAGRERTPELGGAVSRLDAMLHSSEIWALGLGADQVTVWQLTGTIPDHSAKTLEFSRPDGRVAVLATHRGVRQVLCNDDGTDVGVYLRNPESDNPVALSNIEALDVGFISLPVAIQHQVGTYDPVDLEIYAAVADDSGTGKLQVHFQEARGDGTRLTILTDVSSAVLESGVQLKLAAVPQAGPNPLRNHYLYLAIGGGTGDLQDQVAVYKIDFSSVAPGAVPACQRVNQLQVEGLTALCLASIADQPVLLVGRATGLVNSVNALTGAALQQYAHATCVEQIVVADAAGRNVIGVVCAPADDSARPPRISVWDLQSESLLRTTENADVNYGQLAPIYLANVLHLVAAQTEDGDPGKIQLFDPLLTPYRAPELYFASKAPFLDPLTITIHYSDNGPQEVDVTFRPYLLLTDRQDRSIVYKSLLKKILGPIDPVGIPAGEELRLWKLLKPAEFGTDGPADLRWHQAGGFRIGWLNDATAAVSPVFAEHTLEAVLFSQLGEKQIKPVPYSEVAPKIAAVALVDTVSGSPVEVLQRTLFFGDAATAGGGQPEVRTDAQQHRQLLLQALGSETVDLPIPKTPHAISVILVKYLVNGQTVSATLPMGVVTL